MLLEGRGSEGMLRMANNNLLVLECGVDWLLPAMTAAACLPARLSACSMEQVNKSKNNILFMYTEAELAPLFGILIPPPLSLPPRPICCFVVVPGQSVSRRSPPPRRRLLCHHREEADKTLFIRSHLVLHCAQQQHQHQQQKKETETRRRKYPRFSSARK